MNTWDKMKEVGSIRSIQKKEIYFLKKKIRKQRKENWVAARAEELRLRMTESEKLFEEYAKASFSCPIQTQREFIFGKHIYIADFYFPNSKVVVEIDGGYHKEQVMCDEERDRRFRKYHYHVMRFTNEDVENNIERVFKRLHEFVRLSQQKNRCFGRRLAIKRGEAKSLVKPAPIYVLRKSNQVR